MTRKTIIYYGIPLAAVAVVIGICAQSLFWTIYGIIRNGFASALLVVQVLSVGSRRPACILFHQAVGAVL